MSGDWSTLEPEWQPPYRPLQPSDPYPGAGRSCAPCDPYRYYHEGPPPFPEPYHMPPPRQAPLPLPSMAVPQYVPQCPPTVTTFPKGENPREIRNKAEKQRRDKLNQSISELASLVPPVKASSRRIDKTGVLRLTAHYLRAHQYVFGDSLGQGPVERGLSSGSAQALVEMLNGFLLTTTYKGLVVVVSQNVQQYLGFTELDLLGQSILNITHEDDRLMLKDQLMPRSTLLGANGELLVPDDPDANKKIDDLLAGEKRDFIVRFKKLTQRSEPAQYVPCHVEGALRKADRARRGYTRCCQMVRRTRARADNPCSSGNDVVFIGMVRPKSETFISERRMEAFRMDYRTRHSIDGEIIQCEQKISLVTGYMTHEVYGLNAMNFMHRDDVRWVIIALREMYDEHRLLGESCYRLMTKNGDFIYMRTRGCLEVDQNSRAVTTFICNNSVVDEVEGKHLIKMMKKKFTLLVNNNQEPPVIPDEDELFILEATVYRQRYLCARNGMLAKGGYTMTLTLDTNVDASKESTETAVEDPEQLEKVILHLVTNLPSPEPPANSPSPNESPSYAHLSIIPPRRERIVRSISNFYTVFKRPEFSQNHTAEEIPDAHNDNGSTTDANSSTQDPTDAASTQEVINIDSLDEESRSPVAQGFTLKRNPDNGIPVLNAFRDTILARNFEDVQDDDAARFKISDQVLGAVQLHERDPSTGVHKRPACDQDVDEHGYSNKRKVCEFTEPEFAQLEEQEISAFEPSNIDCLFDDSGLDSALNMMQTLGDSANNPNVFPDILLGTGFQDLFGDIENNGQDEVAANGSSPSF